MAPAIILGAIVTLPVQVQAAGAFTDGKPAYTRTAYRVRNRAMREPIGYSSTHDSAMGGDAMNPSRTLSLMAGAGLAAFVALGASGQGQVASDEEAMQVAEKRSETMKSMGGSMRTLKRFVEGRGTAEDASAAAAVIADAAPTLPSLFPTGSGMAALPESESKDVIWEEWDEFVAGTELLGEKAAALQAALASGDSGEIGAAFGDLGKNGCGGCHSKFREKRDG